MTGERSAYERKETPRKKARIAIAGASGRVGQRLQTILSRDYQVTLMQHEHALPQHDKTVREYAGFDITDIESTREALRKIKLSGLDIVINSAGDVKVDQAESERQNFDGSMFKANTIGARNMAIAARDEGLTLIHLSTEYVFDGKKPLGQKYSEDEETERDIVDSQTWYGLTKSLGEKAVLEEHPKGSIIVRLSQVQSPAGGLFLATLRQLNKGEAFTRADNQMVSPITDVTTTLALDRIITAQRTGANRHNIYHVSPTDAATSYQVSMMLAEAYGLGEKAKDLIVPTPIEQIVQSGEQKVVRPKNPVLSVARFENHFGGQILKTTMEEINQFKRLYPNL